MPFPSPAGQVMVEYAPKTVSCHFDVLMGAMQSLFTSEKVTLFYCHSCTCRVGTEPRGGIRAWGRNEEWWQLLRTDCAESVPTVAH